MLYGPDKAAGTQSLWLDATPTGIEVWVLRLVLFCGQGAIATVRARNGDEVAVSEKADGSCCAAARIGDEIIPLIRAGYRASDSIYPQHHVFVEWVRAHEDRFATCCVRTVSGRPGNGFCWPTAHAHDIHDDLDLFPIFEVFTPGRDRNGKELRITRSDRIERVAYSGLVNIPFVHVGGALPLNEALARLGEFGLHHGLERPEGVVYRVENNGVFYFAVKFVMAGNVDGKYLPQFEESVVAVSQPNGPAAVRWIERTGIDVDAVLKHAAVIQPKNGDI